MRSWQRRSDCYSNETVTQANFSQSRAVGQGKKERRDFTICFAEELSVEETAISTYAVLHGYDGNQTRTDYCRKGAILAGNSLTTASAVASSETTEKIWWYRRRSQWEYWSNRIHGKHFISYWQIILQRQCRTFSWNKWDVFPDLLLCRSRNNGQELSRWTENTFHGQAL